MSVDERVLGVVDSLYAAATDKALWSAALTGLIDLTGSQAASFWVLEGSEEPRLSTFIYINLDPAFIQEYLDQMAPLDPTVRYLVSHPGQPVVHDGLFITEREKDRHIYYDWHHRHSETRFRLVSQMTPVPGIQAGVALHRTRKTGRFECGDIEQFAILHRHIERALALGFRLGSMDSMQHGYKDMLDRNVAGIVLLNPQQHVVYANQAATRLCGQGDGLSLSGVGLTPTRRQDRDRLRVLIAQALSMRAGSDLPHDGVLPVQRPSGKRPYLLLIAPIGTRDPALAALRPAVSIVITDPDARRRVSRQRLCAAFGLTDAEARLAAELAAGDDLQAAAERLGIQYATARARLAEIFRKTDTHRQSELIHLILVSLGF